MNQLKKTIRGIKRYYCKHPFEKTIFIYKYCTNKVSTEYPEYRYVVNIRECLFCKEHFIDEGFELTNLIHLV